MNRVIIKFKETIAWINPKLLATVEFYHTFGRLINWKRPKDLNEKINWLKFNSDTSSWTLCADKYRVRRYVEEKGCGDTLVKLYGVWENVNQINWSSLPEQFVMKVNNGSGDILVCRDKSNLNIEEVSATFERLLNKKFSNYNAEPHYAAMKPCIIAEELLDCKQQQIETDTLIDYKIWCFNGKPHHVWACYNRHEGSVEVAIYDLEWKRHDESSVFTSHYKRAKSDLPKPNSLNEMLEIASRLSEGYPQMRVDLYEVANKPYFGELTLTSAGGFMNFYTQDFLNEMGDLVNLNLAKMK